MVADDILKMAMNPVEVTNKQQISKHKQKCPWDCFVLGFAKFLWKICPGLIQELDDPERFDGCLRFGVRVTLFSRSM